MQKNTFVEVCIYEVKTNKTEEFEELIKEVAEHYRNIPGVIDVRYMKRTHRQTDFNAVKNGEPATELKRIIKSVKYVLYWELDNKFTHGNASKLGLEKYYKRFNRCLLTMPNIIIGERIQ
ncbi:MAG TPA: hypothetical protein GXZ90_05655 [Clostridiales bacterium]|nr:hypothetical protein [Clostridiales bacterium]